MRFSTSCCLEVLNNSPVSDKNIKTLKEGTFMVDKESSTWCLEDHPRTCK